MGYGQHCAGQVCSKTPKEIKIWLVDMLTRKPPDVGQTFFGIWGEVNITQTT